MADRAADIVPSSAAVAGADRRLTTLLMLSLIFCLSYIDRMMIGVLAPLLKVEFGTSDTMMGLIIGLSFTFFYAIAGIPLARYADRGSRRLLITISLAFWSLLTMVCGLAQSVLQLFLARILVGIGEAGSSPASMSIIGDIYPVERRPFAMSIYGAGAMLGVMVGMALAGWIGVSYGWRWTFIVLGAPGLAVAAVAWFVIGDPERGGADTGRGEIRSYGFREGIARLFGNTPFVWLIFGQALSGFSLFGMSQWLPSFFVRTHHLPLAFVGLFCGFVMGGGMIAGQLTGGWLGCRLTARDPISLTLPIYGAFLAAPCFLFALWAPSAALAIGASFVSAFVSGLIAPCVTSAIQTILEPRLRSTGAALSNFLISTLGLGLGVLVVGMLSDALTPTQGENALRVSLTVAQGITLLAGLCFVMSRRSSRRLAA